MRRRDFIGAAIAASVLPFTTRAQSPPPRYADMHAHMGSRYQRGYRAQMEAGGMLLVAETLSSDGALLRSMGGRMQMTREPKPGELRANFDARFEWRRQAMAKEGLVAVSSVEALERVLKERVPGLVLAAEGADFLDGELSYLEKARSQGLVHVQLVHYYPRSLLGDIATEAATQGGGVTAFGLDVVRACNRLGMLVDIAHCTNAGMLQVLEVSTKPVVYSHGHVK